MQKPMFKNLADLTRRFVKGSIVTMTAHDWYPKGKLIGVPRTLAHVSSTCYQIENKGELSYLDIPLARDLRFTEEGFKIRLVAEQWITYKIELKGKDAESNS
jgi:hypothetical protein